MKTINSKKIYSLSVVVIPEVGSTVVVVGDVVVTVVVAVMVVVEIGESKKKHHKHQLLKEMLPLSFIAKLNFKCRFIGELPKIIFGQSWDFVPRRGAPCIGYRTISFLVKIQSPFLCSEMAQLDHLGHFMQHLKKLNGDFRCFVDSLFRDCSTDQRYRREVCTAL